MFQTMKSVIVNKFQISKVYILRIQKYSVYKFEFVAKKNNLFELQI